MQHCLGRQRGLQACPRPQPPHTQPACSHTLLWPAQRTVLLRSVARPSGSICCHRHLQQPIRGTSRVWQCRRAPQPLRVAALEPAPGAPESPEAEDDKTYIEVLQECFNIPGFVEIYEGENGQPLVFLMHPNGHSLEIYLQGATITRWLKQDGKSVIFTRPDAVFEPGVPINSGVPIAFPQWREGQLPENGFADKLMWDIVCTDLGFDFMNLPDPPNMEEYEPVDLAGDIVKNEEGEWVAAERQEGEEMEEISAEYIAEAEGADVDDAAEARQEQQEGEEGEEASTSGRGGGDVLDEWAEEFVEGLVGDPSPYVILRLADNTETRAIWPHSFELLLKISLQESDDYPDPKADLPKGVLPFNNEGDLAAAAEMGPNYLDTAYDEGEDEQDGEEEEPEEETSDLTRPVMDAEELPDIEEAYPMQVKMEFCLTHTGGPEEPPFDFQLAAMPHFFTLDQARFGRFVRCLGLGGKQAFDWSYDPRHARLSAMQDDYLTFGDRRIETAVINAHDADVRFCPGDRTHIQLLSREGFKDAVAYHPGPLPPPGQEPFSPYYAVLGPGRVALPKRLKPGEEWRGEFVMRHHNRYWDAPLFDRRGLQPLPPLVPPEDEGEELADVDADEGEAGEGEDDWDADYASDDEEFDIGPGM